MYTYQITENKATRALNLTAEQLTFTAKNCHAAEQRVWKMEVELGLPRFQQGFGSECWEAMSAEL